MAGRSSQARNPTSASIVCTSASVRSSSSAASTVRAECRLDALERQSQRRQTLPELIVQIAGDAAALIFLSRHDLAQQIDDVRLRRLVRRHLIGQRARTFDDTALERAVRVAQGVCRLLLPGEVARDLGKSQVRAGAKPRRDTAGVEQRAVAAQVVALVKGPAGAPRCFEFDLCGAAGAILHGEQSVEVAADDLVGCVAEHPLGATVPRVDLTAVGHRENRVVEGAVDEETQSFFAAEHRRLGAGGAR